METKRPLESKKFIAMILGVCVTILFTMTGLSMIYFKPDSAAASVNLISIALASINGCISLYAIGQSAVDWKLNS